MGGVDCKAQYEIPFVLDGAEGEMGPVPPGVFWLELKHDGVLYAETTQGQGWVQTDAQVSIFDGNDNWDVYNTFGESESRKFKKAENRIDLRLHEVVTDIREVSISIDRGIGNRIIDHPADCGRCVAHPSALPRLYGPPPNHLTARYMV